MKLYSGCSNIIFATFTMFSLSSGSRMVGMVEPGKTPWRRLASRGMSSAISLGTRVSQTDRRSIFCSNYSRSRPFIELMSWFYFLRLRIASLFMLPAETRTLLRARRPKS